MTDLVCTMATVQHGTDARTVHLSCTLWHDGNMSPLQQIWVFDQFTLLRVGDTAILSEHQRE
jgi:hypothetical protein